MPRKRTRTTEARWAADGGGIALGVVALVFFGLAVRQGTEAWTLSRLQSDGEAARVRITKSETRLNRVSTEIVSYEFTPAGSEETVTGQDRISLGSTSVSGVPGMEYLKLRSVSLRARYLASNPRINRLDIGLDSRESRRRGWGAVLLLFAGACGFLGVRRCRR